MTEKELIKELMKKNKLTETELAEAMGRKSNATVWKWLYKVQSVKVSTLLDILDYFGLEVVIRPKGKYRTKYRLTRDSE